MLNYYFGLAMRSLRRNLVLTALMIATVAVGIGAAMTVYSVLRTMSRDPIPDKSSRLYAPQIDNWGKDELQGLDFADQLSYPEAMALMRARLGTHQAAMYQTVFAVQPTARGGKPFPATTRATYADFFPMFETPFAEGGAWSQADDENRARVVVLGHHLAQQLFPNRHALGQNVTLDKSDFRVVGVLKPWEPEPRFYDVTTSSYGEADQIFLPMSTAIERQMIYYGNNSCSQPAPPGWDGHLNSDCVWIQFWVELPTQAAADNYRQYLLNYAAEQQRIGHFHWAPRARLSNVRQWLTIEKVVPDEFRVSTLIAFGFLLVCLLNAIGLMMAKFSGRAGELGVRRALGAAKSDLFLQCLMESAVIGLVGGALGLLLTIAGLAFERAILAEDYARLAHLDADMVLITLASAVFATVCSGLYPAWRASRVQPAWQLKAQ